jgi:small-conductance mechanosensitive channel
MGISLDDLSTTVKENVFLSWGAVIVASVAFAFLLKFILRLVSTNLRKVVKHTKSSWDDIGLDIVDGLRTWVIFLWLFFILGKSMPGSQSVDRLFLFAVVFATIYQTGLWGVYLIRHWKINILEKRAASDPSSSAAIGLLYRVIQVAFLTVLVLIGLSNLGVNITALVTGLGVGGVAVALAAQNVLGDLLASLSIVLDKPFVIGDFIISGSELGTVQYIGIKTTRLASLSGELVVISNKDLLESRIHNYKWMKERRVVQKFSVSYLTPVEQLEKISGWVKEIVTRQKKTRFDRCHFSNYGESSLDFELVFYVLDPDYNIYMDIQQEIFLEIFKLLHQQKIDFAFPARKIYLQPTQPLNQLIDELSPSPAPSQNN